MKARDRIGIRSLVARCILGVDELERREKQDVVVDLVLHTDVRRAAASDAIGDAVDYSAVKMKVLALVEDSSFHLVEALAEAIAGTCLAVEGIEQVDLRIEKPGALRFAKCASIEISRKRGRP